MDKIVRVILLVLILIYISGCKTLTPFEQKIKGNINYQTTTDRSSEALTHQLEYESRYNIYEHSNKKFLVYTGPKIQKDYNHFKEEIKVNVYTTVGLEF